MSVYFAPKVATCLAFTLSLLALILGSILIPTIVYEIHCIWNELEKEMAEFKILSNDIWHEMMSISSNLHVTRLQRHALTGMGQQRAPTSKHEAQLPPSHPTDFEEQSRALAYGPPPEHSSTFEITSQAYGGSSKPFQPQNNEAIGGWGHHGPVPPTGTGTMYSHGSSFESPTVDRFAGSSSPFEPYPTDELGIPDSPDSITAFGPATFGQGYRSNSFPGEAPQSYNYDRVGEGLGNRKFEIPVSAPGIIPASPGSGPMGLHQDVNHGFAETYDSGQFASQPAHISSGAAFPHKPQNQEWSGGLDQTDLPKQQHLDNSICKCDAEQASACPSGPPGPAGVPGQPGPDGLPGVDGHPGIDALDTTPQGLPELCFFCPPGPTGPPGDKGHRGARGPRGANGDVGRPGRNSEPGAPGMAGSMGLSGLPGKPGQMGPPGRNANIPVGATGLPGRRGQPGGSGIKGNDGIPGDPGKQGVMGEVGVTGPIGNPGANGIDGPPGGDGGHGDDGTYCPCPMRDRPLTPVPMWPSQRGNGVAAGFRHV